MAYVLRISPQESLQAKTLRRCAYRNRLSTTKDNNVAARIALPDTELRLKTETIRLGWSIDLVAQRNGANN